jgi:hypothetical protein
MVNDESKRQECAAHGVKSLLNPNVPKPKGKKGISGGTPTGISLDPIPKGSSSSSSSSSKLNPLSDPKDGPDKVVSASPKKPMKQEPSLDASRLAALLKAEILRNKADFRITQQQERNWAVTADRMIRLDARTPEQIAAVIRWAQRDEFWLQNILSMDKLREKFDQLALKAGRQHDLAKSQSDVFANNPETRALAQMESD